MKCVCKILGSLMVGLIIAGCASTGQNFDESKVSQIKKGQTTEAELVQMFGQPTNRAISSEGTTMLTWMYIESRVKGESFIPGVGGFVGGTNSKQKYLTATLGPDGTVQNYTSSSGGTETRQTTQDAQKK